MAKKSKIPSPPRVRSVGDVDKIVGQRVRQLRLQINMSQEELGKATGVSFQQVQKYEKGTNRLSIGRLLQLAELLQTTPHDILGWNIAPPKNPNAYDAELFKLAKAFEDLPEELRQPIRHLINSLIVKNTK